MLELHRYRGARDFLAAVQDWLTDREAEHNLILGLSGALARDEAARSGEGEPAYFATVSSGADPVLAAMRTPPWNLLLSEVDDPAALALLVDDLEGAALPGVTGPPEAARGFADLWVARHGGRHEDLMHERIYRLAHVIAPRAASGAPRRATAGDRPLLAEWVVAFHEEALPSEAERARRSITDWDPVTGRQFWLWEDRGRPVSLVGAGNPTPRGMRIGPVYTPPDLRGRGYATSLTAFVSQRILDEGRSFCFLYTDLANPTSNHIYQAIGYEPVSDALMVAFEQ